MTPLRCSCGQPIIPYKEHHCPTASEAGLHIPEAKTMTPGSPEWLAAKASGPKWSYQDARGIDHIGYMERFNDYGGTDVTYWFRDATTGELTLCSGSRLKAAKRIWS